MNVLLPKHILRWITIAALCIAYALLHATAFIGLVSPSYLILFILAFFDAIFYTLLSLFLYKAIRFGNYVVLERYQRFINYSALGLLSVGVGSGWSLLTSYIVVGRESLEIIWQMMPAKVFIGLLVIILLLQFIHHRVGRESTSQESGEEEELLTEEPENPENTIEIIDRVVVKVGQKIHVVSVADIVYIQADGDYVQLFTHENHYLKEDTMKYFETHLPAEKFVRVHRSYIVNVEKILRIELYEKRNQMLTLANGHKIKASASGYKLLREALSL